MILISQQLKDAILQHMQYVVNDNPEKLLGISFAEWIKNKDSKTNEDYHRLVSEIMQIISSNQAFAIGQLGYSYRFFSRIKMDKIFSGGRIKPLFSEDFFEKGIPMITKFLKELNTKRENYQPGGPAAVKETGPETVEKSGNIKTAISRGEEHFNEVIKCHNDLHTLLTETFKITKASGVYSKDIEYKEDIALEKLQYLMNLAICYPK